MVDGVSSAVACLSWAKSCGAQVDGIEVRSLPGRGNSLVLQSEGRGRIWIPSDLLLSLPNILKYAAGNTNFGKLVTEWSTQVDMTARRAVILLMAYSKRNETPWSVYLDSLPDSIHSPVFWDESTRQLLEGTSIDGVAEDKISFLTAWLNYQQNKSDATEFTKSIDLEELMLYEMLVDSRALLSNEEDTCMVPVIDFANHSSIRPPSEGHQNASWNVSEGGFELLVLPGTVPGSEILFSYGLRGNAELLFKYGFVEDSQVGGGSRSVTIEVPLDLETEFLTEFGEPSFRISSDVDAPLLATDDARFLWLYSLYESDQVDWQKKTFKGRPIEIERIRDVLEADSAWPLYHFKACTVALACVDNHLQQLVETEQDESLQAIAKVTDEEKLLLIDAVRTSEQKTYELNYKRLSELQEHLYGDQIVKDFLASREIQQ